jgi:hypothetical protein
MNFSGIIKPEISSRNRDKLINQVCCKWQIDEKKIIMTCNKEQNEDHDMSKYLWNAPNVELRTALLCIYVVTF